MIGPLLLALAQAAPPADFPVFVWRQEHPGAPLPEALVAPFGGVNVEGAREDTWVLDSGLEFYVGHAPGRDELHLERDRPWYAALWERYYEERDADALLRVPCLAEPATFEALALRLEATTKARGGRHGRGLSLGDEVGLTPYGAPLDLCASETCRERFAAFLLRSSRWRFLLPLDGVPPPWPSTDDVRRAWIAGDASLVAPWLARREFHHEVVHALLARLATRARELAPGTPVGLFGQSGRTAFGDVGVERVLPELDFLEVYRLRDSRELLYTLRDDAQRSYLTVFRDAEAPLGPSWIAWEHWFRGGDGLVVWSDRDLAADAEYLAQLAGAVRGIRRLRELAPEWRPRPEGVALLHSPDSMALSWLRDALHDGPTWPRRFPSYQNEHGTREVSLHAVLRRLEDLGALPGALPLKTIGAATAARFPRLVANHLVCLDADELEQLKAYLRAGGELLLVGSFGTWTRRGERREESGAALFEEALRGRVHLAELDPASYLARRDPALPDGSPWGPIASAAGAGPLSKWKVEGSGPPWLRHAQRGPAPGEWLFAALPNAGAPAQRAALLAATVSFRIPPELEVLPLHPADAESWTVEESGEVRVRVPAGEPLALRLRPR